MDRHPKDDEAVTAEHDSLGAVLRAARQARGLSLQDLAARSGVSVGMISQVERGRANPSMRLLTALRRALNISIQEMFGESPDTPRPPDGDPDFVRRAVDRSVIDLGHLHKELLTPAGRQNLQIMLLTFGPGGHSGGRALSYPAEKGGFLLSGELVLTVDGREATLRAGDSFAFDSALPHAIRNDGQTDAQLVWIIGAVRFDRHL